MSKKLTIHLFGTVSIELDGEPVTDLGTRKAGALLVYLVSQKRPFSREVLANLLWDDRPQKQVLANLRSLLSGLKKQLAPFLNIERHTIGFNHESNYWLDTAEFLQVLAVGDLRLDAGDSVSDINVQSLAKVAALYRGEFMECFYLRDAQAFEEWASLVRERLRRMGEYALRKLVCHHLEKGTYTNGLRFVEQLLKLNNLSEEANRYKMLLLMRSGQRNAALTQYEAYFQLLDEELGVEPERETTIIYQRLKAAQTIPPLNLPPQATPFVGRRQELADFQQHLLDPACRLLTLLGPGGMGKTRLAMAAAERIAQQQPGLFLNGIYYVRLASVPTPDLLVTAVADACHISLQRQDSPLQQLINHLQNKELLLILDNFEHLFGEQIASPDGVDILLQMLEKAPLLQILVTSRERLHLQEEWVFDLGGLDYPPEPPEQELSAYSAVQLFQQNALRIQRQFAPSEADWQAMAQVCRLLEGMPLGIELAAAWTRDFSCPEIAQQIQADVDFLTTKLRNVPSRHRSLTAVFDYSWALLSAEEQAVLARLSVFRGTFSAEAARSVAGADLSMLTGFYDKSLLRKAGNGRYELHQLLRQYASDKLNEQSDDAEETSQRHMTVYLDLLAAQDGGDKPEERQIILTDLPNIRQAWQEASRRQVLSLLSESMGAFQGFFNIQSRFKEGLDLFLYTLACLPQGRPTEPELAQVMCELLGRTARLHIYIGQLDAARQALDKAMMLLSLVEDPVRHSVIVSYAAITTFYAGDFNRATEMMTEALNISQSIDDRNGVALALNFLGSCAKALGDYETAEARFNQAITVSQELGDELGTAMILNNLGNVAQAKGDFATAQKHYLTCSEMFKVLDHSHGAATTLANAGRLALKQAQYEEARSLLSESLTLKRALNDERGTAVALAGLGAVSLVTGAYEQAGDELCEAIELSRHCGDIKLTLEGLSILADLAAKQGYPQEAVTVLSFILAHQGTAQEVRENAERFLVDAQETLPESDQDSLLAKGEGLELETAVSLLQDICLTNYSIG